MFCWISVYTLSLTAGQQALTVSQQALTGLEVICNFAFGYIFFLSGTLPTKTYIGYISHFFWCSIICQLNSCPQSCKQYSRQPLALSASSYQSWPCRPGLESPKVQLEFEDRVAYLFRFSDSDHFFSKLKTCARLNVVHLFILWPFFWPS